MFQPSMSALEQVQPTHAGRMPGLSLSLNHELVLSEWEQMGGNMFSGLNEDPPPQFTLDLSGIEATLHPPPAARAACAPPCMGFPSLFHGMPEMGVPMHSNYPGFDPYHRQEMKFPDFVFPWQKPYMFGGGLATGDVRRQSPQYQLVPNIKQEPGCEPSTRNCSSSACSNQTTDAAVVPDVGSPGSSSPVSHPAAGQLISQTSAAAAAAAANQATMPSVVPALNGANSLRMPVEGEQRTRQQCLERYREKKARRMYAKRIRYQLRKINADKRPRIKGRFVKKEELEEYLKTSSDKPSPDEDDADMVEDDDDGDVDVDGDELDE